MFQIGFVLVSFSSMFCSMKFDFFVYNWLSSNKSKIL